MLITRRLLAVVCIGALIRSANSLSVELCEASCSTESELNVQGLGGVAGASVGPQGVFSGVADIVALPVVVRWNPLKTWRKQQPIDPFEAA